MSAPHTWSEEDKTVAGMEGWGVFLSCGQTEIQRIDDMSVFCEGGDGEPLFASDSDADTFVRAQAEAGSTLHRRALAFIAEQGGAA